MATITQQPIKLVRQSHGSSPKTFDLPEAASQTFVDGEIVEQTNGYVREISSDTPGVILGVAASDASNDSSDGDSRMSVQLADPDNVFEANVLTTSNADHVLVAADLGTTMGIQRDTTNSRVHLNAAVKGGANARVWVWDVAPGSAVGDTNARVLFSFLDRYAQFSSTS